MPASLRPTVYVQISPKRLTLRNLKSGEVISEIPEMAIAPAPTGEILAVGPQARLAAVAEGAKLVNPFAHPRSLISDFTAAEAILRFYLRRILPKSWLSLAPIIILHPRGSPEGDFTPIDLRAFRELGLGAGGSGSFVWTGPELSDDEIWAGRYRTSEPEHHW